MTDDVTSSENRSVYEHIEDRTRLEETIHYEFDDPNLLLRALTHRSYATEHPDDVENDNQRLEFLGDAVLGLIIAEGLFRRDKEVDEGQLSIRQSRVVCEPALADLARELSLGEYLRLGRGEAASGGRDRDSLLADAYEALLAAIYLDAGFEKVRQIVLDLHKEFIEAVEEGSGVQDYKSRLQQFVQREQSSQPEYVIVDEIGPAHDKTFVVDVHIAGKRLGQGRGGAKKKAEQRAAQKALERLEL